MSIIGFNLMKIHVERMRSSDGKISVNNNVSISNVQATPISLGGVEQQTIKVDFKFRSQYDPGVGEISMDGDILWLVDRKQTDELLKGWKEKKVLPESMMRTVLNHILMKCNIEALVLSRDVNLPPPIPMPKVDKGGQDLVEQKKQDKPAEKKK